MAGWGDDTTEIKTGTPASLTLNAEGQVVRINLSQKQVDMTSLPINILTYDLEDALEITGVVLDETKTYSVNHDATIIEEDGTEIRIAPLDVQYQNASIWGRLITNFAGPMNNFILGTLVFILLVFMQGGVADESSNQIQVVPNGALAAAGAKTGDRVLSIANHKVSNWAELTKAVEEATTGISTGDEITVAIQKTDGTKQSLKVAPKKQNGQFYLGVKPGLKTGFWDKLTGGFRYAWHAATMIISALKNLISSFSLNKLGGPVAMYQMSNQAAQNGFEDVLTLMAMLSMNLGIVNLIPIPALDGGKILINLIELVRRKPLKQETETYITLVGVAIMVVLMIAVTWNDILRVFF